MTIDSIKNGYVIDHIKAGKCMYLYNILGLDNLDCPVAIIKNVSSKKLGKKDIIKIDSMIELDLEVLGYVDPGLTVNVISDGALVEKKSLSLPKRIKGVIKCKNPRCITSVEQDLIHEFKLADEEKSIYRCVFCETKAEN